jgi:hypothetical protein
VRPHIRAATAEDSASFGRNLVSAMCEMRQLSIIIASTAGSSSPQESNTDLTKMYLQGRSLLRGAKRETLAIYYFCYYPHNAHVYKFAPAEVQSSAIHRTDNTQTHWGRHNAHINICTLSASIYWSLLCTASIHNNICISSSRPRVIC